MHTQGRSSSRENKIALEYKNLRNVTLRDAVAVRWLRAFSDKWDGEDPPRHVAPLQEDRGLRDLLLCISARAEGHAGVVRDSGRRL